MVENVVARTLEQFVEFLRCVQHDAPRLLDFGWEVVVRRVIGAERWGFNLVLDEP